MTDCPFRVCHSAHRTNELNLGETIFLKRQLKSQIVIAEIKSQC